MSAAAERLGRRAAAMLEALARCSDEPGRLSRPYLGPAHREAVALVGGWMREAGLAVAVNGLGTVSGRTPRRDGARRLLLGSHIDTVPNGGRFDGALGVVAGIVAAEELLRTGPPLPFGLEVLAFGDEEGLRFPEASIGALALTRPLPQALLAARDAAGTTLGEALAGFGLGPPRLDALAYDPAEILGFLEVHIEQGPVLEAMGAPLGVVSAIAAAGRFRLAVAGVGGHAGTVPMAMRHDALAAAAEMILAVEAAARASDGRLCATVGEIALADPAANAIPSQASFSLDLRAPCDADYAAGRAAILDRLDEIARVRGVRLDTKLDYEGESVSCDANLKSSLHAALTDLGLPAPEIASGAGHDAQTIAALAPVAMLFVRCRGGISHHPDEFAASDDIGLAVAALIGAIRRLAAGA